MITVKATREGLVGQKTASGYVIDRVVPYVALPSFAALHLWVKVTNPLTGKSIRALVLDVGPHYTNDTAYVFDETGTTRPKAEAGGFDNFGRSVTNGAGIDLGERVWKALGMTDNTDVEWEWA
jgi:hypothetical protein